MTASAAILVMAHAGAFTPVSATAAGIATAAPDSRIFDDNLEGVVHATSCSRNDVAAAFAQARDGQTVRIPAGNCDWGAGSVSRAGGIRVRGAGMRTTVMQRSAPVTTWGNFLMSFDCSNGKTVEISDIGFLGNDALQNSAQQLADEDAGLLLDQCVDFRVHDIEFREFSNAGLTIRGINTRGVVYRGNFQSNFKCQPTPVDCLGYGVVVYGGDGAQGNDQVPLQLGSQTAVFIEDSDFRDNRHAIASNQGSRYVFRHNSVLSTQRTRDFGLIDAHGRGDYPPGSRSWEIYENSIGPDPSTLVVTGISIRGGDGVIFNNTVGSNVAHVLYLSLEQDCPSSGGPVPDQTREAYIWGNTWNGPPAGYENNPPDPLDPGSIVSNDCPRLLRDGTQYKLSARPGYAPYAYPHPLR